MEKCQAGKLTLAVGAFTHQECRASVDVMEDGIVMLGGHGVAQICTVCRPVLPQFEVKLDDVHVSSACWWRDQVCVGDNLHQQCSAMTHTVSLQVMITRRC